MTSEQDYIRDDMAIYAALAAVSSTEGGQHLCKTLAHDVISDIDRLTVGYMELGDVQLRTICARLQTRLAMYRSLLNAQQNWTDAKERLDELLAA